MTVIYQLGLPRVIKCAASGDVGSEVAQCDPQSIWNPRKTADLSYRRYIVGILTNKANVSIYYFAFPLVILR